MTLAQDVGRSRRKGGDVRDRPPDRLPQPRAVVAEVYELKVRLALFVDVYGLEHDALASLASSDVHVMTSPSDTTVSSLMDTENEAARDRCREAVMFLRRAATNVDEALRAFGPQATQPEPSPDRVVNDSLFHKTWAQDEHHRREEELRR